MAILLTPSKTPSLFITPEQKKQKKLLFVLIAVVLVTILVLYFGLSTPKEPVPAVPSTEQGVLPSTGPAGEEEIISLEAIKSEFNIFSDSKFRALKSFAPKLDISGEKGRTNPFLPY